MIRMIYTPEGIVIGEQINNAEINLLTLKNPCFLTVSKKENDRLQIDIAPLLGFPTEFKVGRGTINHDVTDENVLAVYRSAVAK